MPPKFRVVLFRGWYYVAWKERGTVRRVSLRTKNRDVAEQGLRDFAKQYEANSRPTTITVEYVWNGYRETLKGRPSYYTMGFEARSILASFGLRDASEIRDTDCLEYIAHRRSVGRKDGTIWTELGRLRSALRWAEKKNLIAK